MKKKENVISDVLDEYRIPYVQGISNIMAACVDGKFIAFVPDGTETAFAESTKARGGTVVNWSKPLSKDDVMRVIMDIQKERYL